MQLSPMNGLRHELQSCLHLFKALLVHVLKTFFISCLLLLLLLLSRVSNAQTEHESTDFNSPLLIEFLPLKVELTAKSKDKIKRLLSRNISLKEVSALQELRASIQEDGSYLEYLCEGRRAYLQSYLFTLGLAASQVFVACPVIKNASPEGLRHEPSTLSVVWGPYDPRQEVLFGSGIAPKGKTNEKRSALVNALAVDRTLRVDSEALKGQMLTKEKQNAQRGEIQGSRGLLNPEQSEHIEKKKEKEKEKQKEEEGLQKALLSSPRSEPEELVRASKMDSAPPPRSIAKDSLVHLALGDLARAEGWTFIWYPHISWKAVADISLLPYANAESAVSEVVELLRLEGKPIQLRLSEGNKVMEVLSTEVSHD